MLVEKGESSLNALLLTHFEPMFPFSTPWQFQKWQEFLWNFWSFQVVENSNIQFKMG